MSFLTPTTINGLTAETSPVADDDLLAIWDTSASTTDKVTAALLTLFDVDSITATGSITIRRFQLITLDTAASIALTVSNAPAAGYAIAIFRKGGSGTHTVQLPSGVTWDGTNRTANFDANNDCLIAIAESATRFIVFLNTSVTFTA